MEVAADRQNRAREPVYEVSVAFVPVVVPYEVHSGFVGRLVGDQNDFFVFSEFQSFLENFSKSLAFEAEALASVAQENKPACFVGFFVDVGEVFFVSAFYRLRAEGFSWFPCTMNDGLFKGVHQS